MNKIIISFILFASIFISSCSLESDKPAEFKKDAGIDRLMPSKIAQGKPVYLYPPKNGEAKYGYDSPLAFKPVYDVIDLKYLPAKKTSEILNRVAPDSISIEGERSSMLILKGKPEDVHEIKNLIKSMDQPSPQIMIESRIVEISESGLKNMGLSWGNNGGNFKIMVNGENGKITSDNTFAVLSALISKGEARLIANPKISTLDNNEATVNIGNKIPYAVPVAQNSANPQWAIQYIDAGVSLKITPRLGADGLITVQICPEVSSISEWRSTSAGEFPVISTRNAQTLIRIKDGQTIVIAGLVDESSRENISKIPGLGDIPVIESLFTKKTSEKTKTEIVFMITPHIMAQ